MLYFVEYRIIMNSLILEFIDRFVVFLFLVKKYSCEYFNLIVVNRKRII